MIQKRWIAVLSVFILAFFIGAVYAATEPTVLPFAPKMNSSEPFDDEQFLIVVTPVFNELTTTQLNSSQRMDAESAFYEVTAMKVSPEFYPIAMNVTKVLFYLVSSSESYEEIEKDSGLGTHNSEVRDSLKAQADADLAVAQESWKGLTTLYPNSTLFG